MHGNLDRALAENLLCSTNRSRGQGENLVRANHHHEKSGVPSIEQISSASTPTYANVNEDDTYNPVILCDSLPLALLAEYFSTPQTLHLFSYFCLAFQPYNSFPGLVLLEKCIAPCHIYSLESPRLPCKISLVWAVPTSPRMSLLPAMALPYRVLGF